MGRDQASSHKFSKCSEAWRKRHRATKYTFLDNSTPKCCMCPVESLQQTNSLPNSEVSQKRTALYLPIKILFPKESKEIAIQPSSSPESLKHTVASTEHPVDTKIAHDYKEPTCLTCVDSLPNEEHNIVYGSSGREEDAKSNIDQLQILGFRNKLLFQCSGEMSQSVTDVNMNDLIYINLKDYVQQSVFRRSPQKEDSKDQHSFTDQTSLTDETISVDVDHSSDSKSTASDSSAVIMTGRSDCCKPCNNKLQLQNNWVYSCPLNGGLLSLLNVHFCEGCRHISVHNAQNTPNGHKK